MASGHCPPTDQQRVLRTMSTELHHVFAVAPAGRRTRYCMVDSSSFRGFQSHNVGAVRSGAAHRIGYALCRLIGGGAHRIELQM